LPPKPVTHDRWLKGLQAGFDRMSQPKGSVSRISNLVYTRRGALKTCDGSSIFSALGGMQPLAWDPTRARVWREMVYYQPSSGLRTGYYGIYSDPGIIMGGGALPGGPSLTPVSSTNGLTGTFIIQVTAVDGVGGETNSGGSGTITLNGQAVTLSWNEVPGAYGYNVYIGTTPQNDILWLPPGSNPTANGVSVLGHLADGTPNTSVTIDSTWIQNPAQGIPAAGVNTTSATTFIQIVPGGYSGANIIHVFPASVSVLSTGASIATPTTTDVQAPPPTETVNVHPTASVHGGPGGGPNDFDNPELAQDGNPNTAAVAHVPPGGSNGAGRVWTGFPTLTGVPTALVLNVTTSMTVSNSAVRGYLQVSYSLDGGNSWRSFIAHTDPGGYTTATDAASLPNLEDLSQLRVAVYAAVPSLAAAGIANVWEIWVASTGAAPGAPAGGGAGVTPTISTSATPNGGLEGLCGPLPQIVSFRGNMILALGNGISPYVSDGSVVGTVPITNDFTAVYPAWASGINYNQGDQVQGLYFVFTAVQGGTTGGTTPNWPPTIGQTVPDNNIIWKNTGQVSLSPSPRGAAHAEIYAGSLWVANTWPTMTTDQLDGPSALRMSILNDPNGWNPLNAAQIAPDDSDECQGIKAFTIAEAGIAPQNFLVFFKYFSTYLIQGVFGASNFAITRLQTDLGCIASRTIQFVPGFGIMRLSHLGFAVTDGLNDKLQDPETIRPYLFAESTEADITPIDWSQIWFSKSAQTTDPPMYVAAVPLVGANAFLIGTVAGVTVGVITAGGGTGGGGSPQPGGTITFSPSAVNFGTIPELQAVQMFFTMYFNGTPPEGITSVTLSNSSFEVVGLPILPYSFTSSPSYVTWGVILNQVAGNYDAVMTVVTTLGTFSISLTGTTVSSNLAISPAQVNFANTTVGATSAPQTFTVTNNEATAVTLTGYSLSNPANFTFSPAPTFPMTLNPGQAVTFTVVATPQTAGLVEGSLFILTSIVGIQLLTTLAVTATAAAAAIMPLASTPPGLPAGTYYVQVGLRGPAGVTSLSAVLGPFVVASGQALQVNTPPIPQYYYGWRIWFGPSPTSLNQFVDGNSNAIVLDNPGQGGAPPTGIELSLTRLFCYDLVLKAWTIVDLPFSISAMKQFRVANTIPVTSLGGSYDTAVRRWQDGDPDWDVGALATQPDVKVRWSFRDGEVHTSGASVRIFQNQVIIRGDGGPSSISVTPQTNGYLQTTFRAALLALGDGQFEARARILQAMENLGMTISGVGPAVIESATYNVMPKPVNGALVIS
jgi:hypothetical protein